MEISNWCKREKNICKAAAKKQVSSSSPAAAPDVQPQLPLKSLCNDVSVDSRTERGPCAAAQSRRAVRDPGDEPPTSVGLHAARCTCSWPQDPLGSTARLRFPSLTHSNMAGIVAPSNRTCLSAPGAGPRAWWARRSLVLYRGSPKAGIKALERVGVSPEAWAPSVALLVVTEFVSLQLSNSEGLSSSRSRGTSL